MENENGSDANEGLKPGKKDDTGILELYKAEEEKVKALSHALQGRDEQLARVQQASENALEAYDDLQCRYEASNQVVNTAVLQASQKQKHAENVSPNDDMPKNLYHENKKLKRQSAKLMMKFQEFCSDDIVLQLDDISCESPSLEAEDTNGYVTDLKGRLVKEHNLKEELRNVCEQLNEERLQHSKTKEKLAHQTELLERLQNASVIAVEEYDQMRDELVEKRTIAEKAVNEIREVQKEHNALVRTSAILMGNIPADHKLFEALMEVEKLTLTLETLEIERQKMAESEKELRITTEKLQTRLDCVIGECGKLEEKEKRKSDKINQLENQIADLQKRIQMKSKPPPPPPPPPPPEPEFWNPFGALMSVIGLSRKTKKPIGAVPNEDKAKKAMDDIIEKIEKGTFRLKPTPAGYSAGDSLDSSKSAPQGIQEMRSVLSTLRKGKSMREPSHITEMPKRDFGYSLRLKPRQITGRVQPEQEQPPELEGVLLRRRLVVDATNGSNGQDPQNEGMEAMNTGGRDGQKAQEGPENANGQKISRDMAESLSSATGP